MQILFIGDVVSNSGCEFLKEKLWNLRKSLSIDMVICNGENSADGNGILPHSADKLFAAGVDVITGGNHTFKRKEIYEYLDDKSNIIRPYNYPAGAPGTGYCIYSVNGVKVGVLNLIGLCYMDFLDCPFRGADKALESLSKETNNIIVDFHAEATSEKRALAEYLSNRVTAVLGTHTHVATADECILNDHTAFISDVGMTGATNSILGVDKERVIERFITKLPTRFKEAKGKISMDSVLIAIDDKTGKAQSIERIKI